MKFIELTTSGGKITVNADQIIAVYEDSTIRLTNGYSVIVKETREEITKLLTESKDKKTAPKQPAPKAEE